MVHVFTSVKEGHTMGLEKVSVNCASLYTTNYLNTSHMYHSALVMLLLVATNLLAYMTSYYLKMYYF